jgi:hypothetical protein
LNQNERYNDLNPTFDLLLALLTDTKRTSQSPYTELAQALETFVAEISTNNIPDEGLTIPLVINRKEDPPGSRRKIDFKLKIFLLRVVKFNIKETPV